MENQKIVCTEVNFGCLPNKLQNEIIGNNDDLNYRIKYYAQKSIEADKNLDNEAKEILLSYPVVYVHTWRNEENELFIYVGETINLLNRTSEHLNSGVKDGKWQTDWRKAIGNNRAKSFYFGGRDMNKSMVQDIEDCLITILENNNGFNLVNKRGNPIGNYNNKCLRNDLIKKIWGILSNRYNELSKINFMTDDVSGGGSHFNGDNLEVAVNPDIAALDETVFANYPVVYMFMWLDDKGLDKESKLCTYVGETNNLLKRKEQHSNHNNQWSNILKAIMKEDMKDSDAEVDWHTSWDNSKNRAFMMFAHSQFNKSMTMDIENRLIHYTKICGTSRNGRTNPQNQYSNVDKCFDIFKSIVDNEIANIDKKGIEFIKNNENPFPFLSLQEIQDKAPFMAAPFLTLTTEQKKAQKEIADQIKKILKNQNNNKHLFVIQGGAGTGKTVLISSLLFKILEEKENYKVKVAINNGALIDLYENMNTASGLNKRGFNFMDNIVDKAQTIINKDDEYDIIFVEEGHLLYKETHMGSIKGEQFQKLTKKAKVTILVYDPFQSYHPRQLGGVTNFYELIEGTEIKNITQYDLKTQLRMQCSKESQDWIMALAKGAKLPELKCKKGEAKYLQNSEGTSVAYTVKDTNDYEITLFAFAKEFKKYIKEKGTYSGIVATYDWKNDVDTDIKVVEDHINNNKSFFSLGKWCLQSEKTSGEIKSIHNVQGFDLEFVGVVLGPSITVEKDNIDFVKNGHGGIHEDNIKDVVSHELGVLLTRGAKGLVLYATSSKVTKIILDSLLNSKEV